MDYENWKPIYTEILKDFNFSKQKDTKAAEILNYLLDDKDILPISKIKNIIQNKDVVVFGAGPSLVNQIKKHLDFLKDKILITADGATSALLKYKIKPDIIVTDLDGKISDQIQSNSNGSIVVIHAHGDNILKLKNYVPKFKKSIIGTTQTNPAQFQNLHNFGGFTDGDRGVFIADHFKAKNIFLIGFDFNGKIGKYSFSKKKNKKIKLKKLKWCKYLVNLLNNRKKIFEIS